MNQYGWQTKETSWQKLIERIPRCLHRGQIIFNLWEEVKKMLWGGHFWTSGYYVNTVGQFASEEVIRNYVEKQGMKYQQLFSQQQSLFDRPEDTS